MLSSALCILQILSGLIALYVGAIPVLGAIVHSSYPDNKEKELGVSVLFLAVALLAPLVLIGTGVHQLMQVQVNWLVLSAPWITLFLLAIGMILTLSFDKDDSLTPQALSV